MISYFSTISKILGCFAVTAISVIGILLLSPELNSIEAGELFDVKAASLTLARVAFLYFLALCMLMQIVVYYRARKKLLLTKQFINCVEYSYLLLAAFSIFSVISAVRDISLAYVDFDRSYAHERVERTIGIIEHSKSGICRHPEPYPHLEQGLREMCQWYDSAESFLTDHQSTDQWKKLQDSADAIRRKLTLLSIGHIDEFVSSARYQLDFSDVDGAIDILASATPPQESINLPSTDLWSVAIKVIAALAAGFAISLRLGKLTAEVLKIVV